MQHEKSFRYLKIKDLRQRRVNPQKEQSTPLLISWSFDRPKTISFSELHRLCSTSHIENSKGITFRCNSAAERCPVEIGQGE
jgi:hypothetical protein